MSRVAAKTLSNGVECSCASPEDIPAADSTSPRPRSCTASRLACNPQRAAGPSRRQPDRCNCWRFRELDRRSSSAAPARESHRCNGNVRCWGRRRIRGCFASEPTFPPRRSCGTASPQLPASLDRRNNSEVFRPGSSGLNFDERHGCAADSCHRARTFDGNRRRDTTCSRDCSFVALSPADPRSSVFDRGRTPLCSLPAVDNCSCSTRPLYARTKDPLWPRNFPSVICCPVDPGTNKTARPSRSPRWNPFDSAIAGNSGSSERHSRADSDSFLGCNGASFFWKESHWRLFPARSWRNGASRPEAGSDDCCWNLRWETDSSNLDLDSAVSSRT